MGLLIGVALLAAAAQDPGCSAEAPTIISGGPAGGIVCCADRIETTEPGSSQLEGNVRCEVYAFRVTASEMSITKGEDSASRVRGAPVAVEARGGARVQGRGNTLSGETILLEFERPAVAERLTVIRPRESWSGRLLPLFRKD